MVSFLLHLAFVFVVVGVKLVLALWAIYYLFPAGRRCPACDAETLPLRLGATRKFFGWLLFLGRVQRRWCPECSWDGFARPVHEPGRSVQPAPTGQTIDHST